MFTATVSWRAGCSRRQRPTCRQASWSTQLPTLGDEPGLLGERDEVLREQVAELRMLPAHQRLDAGHGAGAEGDDRLVVEHQLALLERAAQGALELEAMAHIGRHLRGVGLEAALAGALGGVHGGVGVAEHLAHALARRGGGDADAGGDEHLVAAQHEGLRHGAGEPLDQGLLFLGSGGILDQDGELVAAEPGDGVGGTGAGAEALGGQHQQLVALAVTKAVVDLLEVIEVEEEHGDGVPLPLRELERVIHAVAEEGAVGQPGERVVEGLVQQLLLEALPLGDVAGVEHDAVHDRVAQQVGGDDLGVERRTVGLLEAPLGGGTHAARRASPRGRRTRRGRDRRDR